MNKVAFDLIVGFCAGSRSLFQHHIPYRDRLALESVLDDYDRFWDFCTSRIPKWRAHVPQNFRSDVEYLVKNEYRRVNTRITELIKSRERYWTFLYQRTHNTSSSTSNAQDRLWRFKSLFSHTTHRWPINTLFGNPDAMVKYSNLIQRIVESTSLDWTPLHISIPITHGTDKIGWAAVAEIGKYIPSRLIPGDNDGGGKLLGVTVRVFDRLKREVRTDTFNIRHPDGHFVVEKTRFSPTALFDILHGHVLWRNIEYSISKAVLSVPMPDKGEVVQNKYGVVLTKRKFQYNENLVRVEWLGDNKTSTRLVYDDGQSQELLDALDEQVINSACKTPEQVEGALYGWYVPLHVVEKLHDLGDEATLEDWGRLLSPKRTSSPSNSSRVKHELKVLAGVRDTYPIAEMTLKYLDALKFLDERRGKKPADDTFIPSWTRDLITATLNMYKTHQHQFDVSKEDVIEEVSQ